MNSLLLTDGYKTDHRRQYPQNTTKVVSNWTPRGSRKEGINKVVNFGLQAFIKKYMIEDFRDNFFNRSKESVLKEYTDMMNSYLGPNQVGEKHIADLHDLGYLPIAIYSVPEGHQVPLRVPMFSLFNTKDEFFWLTNYFETIISTSVWLPMTSASIAKQYREQMDSWAKKTSSVPEFVDWQGHDFSMRGMAGLEAAQMSGAAHLLSFYGTDTIPAISYLQKYYNATGLIGGTVSSTEHSVASMNTIYNEIIEEYKVEVTYDDNNNIIKEIEIK